MTQFTYFQQVGGLECKPITGEITYGLERLATYIQGVDSVYDRSGATARWVKPLTATCSIRTKWNNPPITSNTRMDFLFTCFEQYEKEAQHRWRWRLRCRCLPTSVF